MRPDSYSPSSLQLFNVFGMIRVERSHVSALASAVLPTGRSVEQTASRDLEEPIQKVPEGETCVLLIAAMVQSGRKSRVAVQQLSKRIGGPDVINEKTVRDVLNEVIKAFE